MRTLDGTVDEGVDGRVEGPTITSFRKLQRAVRDLGEDMERQRVVWLEGRHLVHQVEIAPEARVERVGGGSG